MSNDGGNDEFVNNLRTIIEVRQALRGIRRVEEERGLIRFFAVLLSLFSLAMCLVIALVGFVMIGEIIF